MYLPIFIAILLGLMAPSDNQSTNCNNGGTVYTTNTGGEGDPGNDPGTPTTPGGDTGGENGNNPPRID